MRTHGVQQILAEKTRFSHWYVSERQLWGECLWLKKLNNPLYLCRYGHIHCLNCCSSHFSSEHGWNQFFWISTDQGNYNKLTRRAAKAACCPKKHTWVPALQRSCPLPPLCSTLHRPVVSRAATKRSAITAFLTPRCRMHWSAGCDESNYATGNFSFVISKRKEKSKLQLEFTSHSQFCPFHYHCGSFLQLTSQ